MNPSVEIEPLPKASLRDKAQKTQRMVVGQVGIDRRKGKLSYPPKAGIQNANNQKLGFRHSPE